MKHSIAKLSSVILCLAMVFACFSPISTLAAVEHTHDSSASSDHYYNVVTKKDWDTAPGISETEISLKSKDGTRNQRAHIMVADMNNEYTKVTTSYSNMDTSVYRTTTMVEQAQAAINLGWNVVGTMNTCLSWYTGYPAEHVNEPLGFMMIDGETVWDLTQRYGGIGFPECLVINRADSESPRVEIRNIKSTEDLTGDEEQVIPCSSGYIVKNGINQTGAASHANGSSAPRSVVGITADAKVVIMMNDGRASFSDGMTTFEAAELMIDLGCVFAVNCDGGGSSTFLSKRPGETLQVHCTPSDGSLRTNTSGILFVSTAPADGQFATAHISTAIDNKYYLPGSTVNFNAYGTDFAGTNVVDIPNDAVWTIKESGMGTISDGVFVSNGTAGTVTAQIEYDNKVVGSCEIEMVVPTAFAFTTKNFAVKYGTSYELTTIATVNDGVNEVVLPSGTVSITCNNAAIGTISGTVFTAVSAEDAPNVKNGTITATLSGTALQATATLLICPEITEVIEDFEDGINGWNIKEVRGVANIPNAEEIFTISAANAQNGQVHDGNGSMRVNLSLINDGIPFHGGSTDYAQLMIYPDNGIELKNVESYGFWIYVPFDFLTLKLKARYFRDNNGDGVYETMVKNVSLLDGNNFYNDWSESGWYYASINVGGGDILLAGKNDPKALTNNQVNGDVANSSATLQNRDIEIQVQPAHENQNFYDGKGTVNGIYTLYIDSLTVDYAKDVADRTAPAFGDVTLLSQNGENDQTIANHTFVTTSSNVLDVTASVSDSGDGLSASTAKAYVDGKEVTCGYADGRLSINNVAVANGMHRVKFEIADRAGNKNTIIRLIKVESSVSASTIIVEPKDSTLDKIPYGSVYWMNVKANAIETVQSVSTTIDINSVNHWELAHMELAAGFSATYSVNDETNTATITITRTGKNSQTGTAVIASLPIRIVDLEHDIICRGLNASEYWQGQSETIANNYGLEFWEQDLKVDVLRGIITYVDGYSSQVLNTFSNEEFSVSTETFVQNKTMKSNYTEYYNNHGAVHTHTAVALADHAATCTEAGYTDRTYCEVCNSVVDWGTTVPMTAHSYARVSNQLICSDCGDVYDYVNGFATVNNKTYYVLNGTLQSGWQPLEDDWYYFDTTTYEGLNGIHNSLSITNTTKSFDYSFTNGKLDEGVWVEVENEGIRYYYGPNFYKNGFQTIAGKQYYFDKSNGYRLTGCQHVSEYGSGTTDKHDTYYIFDDDGSLIRIANGIINYNGTLLYVENGLIVYAGLIQIDGDFYYVHTAGNVAVNETCSVHKTNNLLPEGTYTFGADGKMQIDLSTLKNGLYEEDGKLNYYVNSVLNPAGLIKIYGYYYYITGTGAAAVSTESTLTDSATNDLLPAGTYSFDNKGRLIREADGDLDLDGVMDASDLIVMQKCLLEIFDAENYACDVNNDGVTNILDLIRLKKTLA